MDDVPYVEKLSVQGRLIGKEAWSGLLPPQGSFLVRRTVRTFSLGSREGPRVPERALNYPQRIYLSPDPSFPTSRRQEANFIFPSAVFEEHFNFHPASKLSQLEGGETIDCFATCSRILAISRSSSRPRSRRVNSQGGRGKKKKKKRK